MIPNSFKLALVPAISLCAFAPPLSAGDGNRLSHLDEPNNPWQSHHGSAKLVTPQWIGEDGVEAVVVLAIDDLNGDGQHFRNYLTPIIERLQKIDGRGPVSITCNRPDPVQPNMQWFLEQGVSLETHTLTHPCPLLQRRNFGRANADYHGCVDLLAKIPNNHSVGFRFPCMDGQNTPSPRAYAELLNGVSDEGRFVSMSTSVGLVFTKDDAELPRAIFAAEEGGADRFARYLRPGYVNYVENYPYPFVVGKLIWELPFVLPDDYLGNGLHGNQNPITTADFKATVDAAVAKRGAVAFCFHAGEWIRNDQMVDIVDHVDRKHGAKVKFLNMSEMHERMTKNMLAGHPLRNAKGKDNGVRVFDIDGDGYMDVLIGNSEAKLSRLWEPEKGSWRETPFPVEVTPALRFGVLDKSGWTVAINSDEKGFKAWRFDGGRWIPDARLVAGLDRVSTQKEGKDSGVRLHDINGDGICELIVASNERSEVYERKDDRWHKLPFGLPKGTAIVTADGGDAGLRFADLDDDGSEDIIFSDAARYGTWMFESMKTGWSRPGIGGQRTNAGVGEQHSRDRKVLPPIVRADGTNNGAWVKRGHVYWQNEDTGSIMAHHIDKRGFTDLMGEEVNKARSPKTSLKAMEARPGFSVELVAAEPLVMDPVDIAWGPDGRMWVCEMADYPRGIDNKDKHGSRVAYLTDTDGDGRYDKRTLFAEGLGYANTVLPWRDGVLIVAAPRIWFMRDTDGDGRADERRVLYEGFGEGNEQHRSNGLAWGLDGWLYLANGDSGGEINSVKTKQSLKLGGFDLRIRPDSGELEPATGITQHGRNRDDWGNWVGGNNSGAWQIALEDHYIRRNPRVPQPPTRNGILGVIDLFPASQVLSHFSGYTALPAGAPGKMTSGCGYTFYRDSLFDRLVKPSIYLSCPVHNCVHREEIQWNGLLMQTSRSSDEASSEFLRSADSWFRPTAIRTGPDGALYIADMYRLVIEHPEWIDKTLLAEMIADGRLRAGEDHGRIYKIFPTDTPLNRPQILAGKKPAELAAALDTANGWQRDTAHMMLTWLDEAAQRKAVSTLKELLRNSKQAPARTQALSALADLGALGEDDVKSGLGDAHPGVRRNALRVGAGLLDDHTELGERVIDLLGDSDPQVQMQATYALGEWKVRRAGIALGRFVVAHADRPYLRAAALTSAGQFLDEVLFAVLAADRTPATTALVNPLMEMLGAEEAHKFVPQVLKRLTVKPEPGQGYEAWRFAATARLLKVLGGPDTSDPGMNAMLDAARAALVDEEQDLALRLAAESLVEQTGSKSAPDTERLIALMKVTTPIELQVAAAKGLLLRNDEAVARRLLLGWSGFGSALRAAILDSMLARPELSHVLLGAISENSQLAVSMDFANRQRLLNHEDAAIRERSKSLLGGATRPDRAAVIEKYAVALSKPGDRDKGKAVFATACIACHRLDGLGNNIGPDLAALSNRDPQTYLTGILDPNRAIQENWMQFVAKTKDGRTLLGALAEETSSAATLVGIDGTKTKIQRHDLESLQSTSKSLMPEGLEALINLEQMADLIAYLQSAGQPRKIFPGNEPQLMAQADDNSVTLPAAAAEIYGQTLVFEESYRTLGYWSSADDRAEWTFSLERDGDYDLWVDWALQGSESSGRIRFAVGGHSIAAAVPATGSWDTYRWGRVGSMKLSAGTHRLIGRSDGSIKAGALIDLRHVKLVPADRGMTDGVEWPGSNPSASATQRKPTGQEERSKPFGGKPSPIPGIIEAEHYDVGSPGVAYRDLDEANQGVSYRKKTQVDIEKRSDASNGHGIGWAHGGEWLNYTVEVAADGNYAIEIPVASHNQGGLFHLEIDGIDLTGPIRIPDTGGWKTLKTISHKGVSLKKGVYTIRLVMDEDGPSGYIGDIDSLKFTAISS